MNPGPFRVVWKRSAIEIQIAEVGESRPNFERIHTEPPLTVRFAVHEDERLVYVLWVSYLLPRHLRG